jgi:biotin carboxyl carrier protein
MAVRRYRITVNGQVFEVLVEALDAPAEGGSRPLPPPSAPLSEAAGAPQKSRPVEGSGRVEVTSPLPGAVLEVKVAPGQEVSPGQVLVILEAMKMENEIIAPRAGRVAEVAVAPGQSVSAGDLLVSLE